MAIDNLKNKIDMILEWAASDDSPEDWDTEFVESLEIQLEEKGFLTEAQEAALDNIIDAWRIG